MGRDEENGEFRNKASSLKLVASLALTATAHAPFFVLKMPLHTATKPEASLTLFSELAMLSPYHLPSHLILLT